MDYVEFIKKLNFTPKENAQGLYEKEYSSGYRIEFDILNRKIMYPTPIKQMSKTTGNFSQAENFVVLECVDRLLKKGYPPQNIILEKTWPAGHGTSGRLDICVTRDDGSEYLLIECKTPGKEFDEAKKKLQKDGGQLFTYFKFSNKADVIMLYASELQGDTIVYQNEIIPIEDDYRIGDVKDFYEKWNKLTKDNGIFDNWVKLYCFESKALTIKDLVDIKLIDSSFIFNRFLEILRHNVVSDKPNAFNKIFTLFLCKIYDEKMNEDNPESELGFQWFNAPYTYNGKQYDRDTDVSFQLRLTDLYKEGMEEFLEKKVTDISESEFDKKFADLALYNEDLSKKIKYEINRLRLEKNNEFAIKEVYDEKSFKENAKVVKEIVELLQKYKIRYTQKQQYLSDFFELLLTTGLKQESGQFFTPVPIAQFIIRSLPIDKIINVKLVENKKGDMLPYIIDYAAGSGHFITESMSEIQKIMNDIDSKTLKGDAKKLVDKSRIEQFDWALSYIYGIEKDYRLVKVGKVGCYLHGDGLANVIHSDGLAKFGHSDYKEKLQMHDADFHKENKQFDIVVSNPPYSVSAFKNAAKDYYSKDDFELYDNLTDNSSEIECLFVERTKQLLKNGGLAGIILPSSILSNSGIYTKTREIILQFFEIIAISELGSNTFMATGTNTIILFLRRRDNYDSINLDTKIERIFKTLQDGAVNGIENPATQYARHVWDLSFSDYITLLQKTPNKKVAGNEIYKEYRKHLFFQIDPITPEMPAAEIAVHNKLAEQNEKRFWENVIKLEKEKLRYFILCRPQKVVLIKTGGKDAEKRFLGYEFSNRRGSEGIHPIQRDKTIDECTQLFDANDFNNLDKASAYIYRAFSNDFPAKINEGMKNNISRVDLIDMLTFDRTDFEKTIALNSKKKLKVKSKWDIVKLDQIVDIVRGASPRPIKKFITDDPAGINWIKIGDVTPESKYISGTKERITSAGAEKSRFVKSGDFILSNSMSFGRPYIMKISGCIHDGWLLMTDFDTQLDKDYFYYILSHEMVQEQFMASASGGTSVDNLNIEKVSNVKIPLPPIDIQQKIVAEIEAIEKTISRVKTKIETLQNKIYEMIKNIDGTVYKVSDVISLEYGASLPANKRINGKFPVMGSNGIDGYHNAYLIEGPSIIVGRKGSAGKVTWVDKNNYPIDTTFYVKQKDNKNSLKLLYYILSNLNLEQLSSGVGVPGLNRNDAYNLTVKLPALIEQKKIVGEIVTLENQIAEAQLVINSTIEQKDAVLKKYL
ncbi:restriction endonuclease [Spirochaetia bacterium]|nr:restriction endonuclease [Spirochaetia bacterium]